MTNTTISDIVRYADKTARERNVKWMDTTILLKSLLWSAIEFLSDEEKKRLASRLGFERIAGQER